jgi:hypothetical protein
MKRTVLLILLVMLGEVSAIAETNLALRTYIEGVLMREDYPHKEKDIVEYAKTLGLAPEQVARELGNIVNDTLAADESQSERYVLSKMAIDALGTLGDSASLPNLSKASRAKDRNRRISAIRAYVGVAQEDSLGLAEEIVTNTNQWGPMERRILYERLAKCAKKTDDPALETKRSRVRRFLVDSAQTEADPDAAKKLDEVLCGISSSYKTSLQRESVAERFQNAKASVYADYFNGVLTELREIPTTGRTDVAKTHAP